MKESFSVQRRPGLVVIIGFLTLLAGHFTLDRAGFRLPIINDTRVIIFALLLAALALELTKATRPGRAACVRRRFLYPTLIFFSYQAVSTAWSPDGARVKSSIGDLLAIAVLVSVYWTLADWDRDCVVQITLFCFLVAGVVYFMAAASGRGHDPSGRWAALGGGANVFVRIMVVAAIAAVYFYVRSGYRAVWLFPVPAFISGAVLSGSRGGVAAALSLIVLATPALLPRLRAGRVVSLAATALLLAGATWWVAGAGVWHAFHDRFVVTTFENQYTSDRDVLYRKAVELFLAHPVAGTGLDGFFAIDGWGGVMYVHNLPLSVAAEGGVIGLALLGSAIYSLRRGYAEVPLQQRTLESRTAAYCGIFFGGASLFSGNYYDARLMWVFLTLAAVAPLRRVAGEPAPPVLGRGRSMANMPQRQVRSGR